MSQVRWCLLIIKPILVVDHLHSLAVVVIILEHEQLKQVAIVKVLFKCLLVRYIILITALSIFCILIWIMIFLG